MRWLVIGPYPPETSPGAVANGRAAADLIAAGHEVHAVSPQASAAHEQLPVTGPGAALRLARLARGFDGVHLRLEHGVLLSYGVDGRAAMVQQAGLALLLKAAGQVVVDLPEVGLVARPAGRPGAAVLGAASARWQVPSTHDANRLAGLGVDAARIEVTGRAAVAATAPVQPGRRRAAPVPVPALELSAEPTVAEIAAAIARRAAPRREADPERPSTGGDIRPSTALRLAPPLVPPPRSGSSLVATVVRSVVGRLTAWQTDWVTWHVNQLHAAALEVAERLEERDDPSGG